jgi:exopolysaccharide production protein ExoZ
MTFRGVQALRGFAAAIVVVFHGTLSWWRIVGGMTVKEIPGSWWTGAAGVDIFFVISGFVMAVSTFGKENQPHASRRFLERRAVRLLPMYWIMTAFFALELLWLRSHPMWRTNGENYAHLTPGFFLGSLTMIPFYHGGSTDPLVAVGWTLSFEIFFYLLIAIALGLHMKPIRFLVPAIFLLVLAGRFHKRTWPAFTLLANPLLLEFLAGVLVGVVIMRGFRLHKRWGLALTIIGLFMILLPRTVPPMHRTLTWGVPALMIVLGIALFEGQFIGRWPKWTLLLGDASYSLYLSHVLVLHLVSRAFEYRHLVAFGVVRRRDEVLLAVTCLALAIPFSLLIYRWVEKPVTNRLRWQLAGEDMPPSNIERDRAWADKVPEAQP